MRENYTSKPMRIDALRYTGTNAAELIAVFGGWLDDNGEPVMPVYGEGSSAIIHAGDAVFMDPLQGLQRLDADTFAILWQLTAAMPTITPTRAGRAPVPAAMLAGATRAIEVTLNGSMPTTDYVATATLEQTGTIPLGALQVVGVLSERTTSKVTVLVRNTGVTAIASPAATVAVIATAAPTT